MKRTTRGLAFVALLALAGCGGGPMTPDRLRSLVMGASHDQVRALLGPPDAASGAESWHYRDKAVSGTGEKEDAWVLFSGGRVTHVLTPSTSQMPVIPDAPPDRRGGPGPNAPRKR